MNVVEKLYTEWAWRSKSGTPNINNPEDKAILNTLIAELTGENNPSNLILENSDDYDNEIVNKFGEIPTVNGQYTVPAGSGTIKVDRRDLDVYKKMFKLSTDQTVGPGELAMYWLYQYQKSPITTLDNRGADKPDLMIGSKRVEVKAYGKHSGKIKLGKFGSQKENIRLLNITFGFHTLVKVLNLKSSAKAVTSTNFNPKELLEAFGEVMKIKDSGILAEGASQFELIAGIKEKLDILNSELNSPSDSVEATKALLSRMVMSKFNTKPGDEGYIASALIEGEIHFFYIDFDKLRQSNLLDLVEIKGGEIAVDFKSIFG
jgi:hypothetical protein